ncbi:MAG: hypothetical protein KC609_24945 [Myxococcales bacterium]|nr:hypothetical protein [Myxococcales bacterium]
MSTFRRVLLIISLVIALVPGPIEAETKNSPTAAQTLQLAQNAFNFQEYDKAQKILADLLAKRARELSAEDENVARELLGACYFRSRQTSLARIEFTTLLVKNPAAHLNPFVHPASLINYFDELRKDLIRRGVIQDVANKPKKKPSKIREIWRYNTYALNFVPFGVGQFQNGQTSKGTLFAVFQGLALLTNITTYLYIETRLIDKRGIVTDARTARALQITQYASLGLFIGLVAWGIIDAVVYYQPKVLIKRDEVPLKPERKTSKQKKNLHFYLAPAPTRNGGATLQFGATF